MNYIDSDMVKEYIENEINYIQDDIENNKKYNNWRTIKDLEEDIKYLKELSQEDIKEITQKVNDDEELQDKITELIHYWLYHK